MIQKRWGMTYYRHNVFIMTLWLHKIWRGFESCVCRRNTKGTKSHTYSTYTTTHTYLRYNYLHIYVRSVNTLKVPYTMTNDESMVTHYNCHKGNSHTSLKFRQVKLYNFLSTYIFFKNFGFIFKTKNKS